MTERQYLLQHILHLSSQLQACTDKKQEQNIKTALLFYSRALQEHDKKAKNTSYLQ